MGKVLLLGYVPFTLGTSADVLIWVHEGPQRAKGQFKDYELGPNCIVLLFVLCGKEWVFMRMPCLQCARSAKFCMSANTQILVLALFHEFVVP